MNTPHPIGSCEHGKTLHYGFPCSQREAKAVVHQIQEDLNTGGTTENGLLTRIEARIVTAIASNIERVQQYGRKM